MRRSKILMEEDEIAQAAARTPSARAANSTRDKSDWAAAQRASSGFKMIQKACARRLSRVVNGCLPQQLPSHSAGY